MFETQLILQILAGFLLAEGYVPENFFILQTVVLLVCPVSVALSYPKDPTGLASLLTWIDAIIDLCHDYPQA